jgi:hypothetical protein
MGGTWQAQVCSDEACQAVQCPNGFDPSGFPCPPDYHAQTLGCGYDAYYGDTGCLCTG